MGSQKSYKKKGRIKQILKDHFHGFWEIHAQHYPESVRDSLKENVEKAMKCGSRDLGYAVVYECKGCQEGEPEPVFVCFTCKSRICHGCGKKYTDDWTEKQVEGF